MNRVFRGSIFTPAGRHVKVKVKRVRHTVNPLSQHALKKAQRDDRISLWHCQAHGPHRTVRSPPVRSSMLIKMVNFKGASAKRFNDTP
jgi:hypothetical protein